MCRVLAPVRAKFAFVTNKTTILDIFHDVKPEYLQIYLNGFCYKFNRPYSRETLFDSMLTLPLSTKIILGTISHNHKNKSL